MGGRSPRQGWEWGAVGTALTKPRALPGASEVGDSVSGFECPCHPDRSIIICIVYAIVVYFVPTLGRALNMLQLADSL